MSPNRDATNIAYTAGALLILNGLRLLANGHTALGVASVVVGSVLIVQRLLLNRKRKRAHAEKMSRLAKEQ